MTCSMVERSKILRSDLFGRRVDPVRTVMNMALLIRILYYNSGTFIQDDHGLIEDDATLLNLLALAAETESLVDGARSFPSKPSRGNT